MPDQVAIYHKSNNTMEVKPYDKNLFAQWRGGYLSFERMYLNDITRLLERNYNVVFRYDNQKIKTLRFSGSFRNSEDLGEILNVIRINTGISYHVMRDTVVIK
jgi:ferric-dicitrate binding protein FerR (iron transport regulator)